jgi:uncharacterized protein YdaL
MFADASMKIQEALFCHPDLRRESRRSARRGWISLTLRSLAFSVPFLVFAIGLCDSRPSNQIVSHPLSEVLVVHDSLPGPLPSGVVVGNNILDLLGHFGLHGTLIPIEEYKPGELSKFRFVIVLAVDDRAVSYPQVFLNDVRKTQLPVFWIERHLGELLADQTFAARLGFKLSARFFLSDFISVTYKGKSLPKKEAGLFSLDITDQSRVQVLATAEGKDDESKPYIVRSGSFWYCADSPFAYAEEGDRYLVFCDLLHDFFKMPHQIERKALLRLEDVTLASDPDQLRSIADYLYGRKIPFQVSIVPIFKDPENNTELYLSDRPQFVRAIHYMVSKGGTVVMHGITHQYHGVSGDDFEFWDELPGKPISGDSRLVVEQKLRLGLEECFKNGIYPVTWETPHYVASMLDYQTIARYFNSSYERVASVNNGESGHYFPFPTVDRFGRFIIPECLGYIPAEKPDPAPLVAACDRLQVVRDGVASFFFHPFLDQDYLAETIDGIQELGYRFASIRDYDLKVQMDDHLVQSYTDNIQIAVQSNYLHRLYVHADGKISGESYLERPRQPIFRDPGIVPPDSILVLEGVNEILSQREPPPPSRWEAFWSWIRKKFQNKPVEAAILEQPQAIVLWDDSATKGDWNNQKSYVSAMSAFGIRTSTHNWKAFVRDALEQDTVLVIPRAVATKLAPGQVEWIQEYVWQGGRLVLDGPSALSQSVGVRAEKRSLKVQSVAEMLYGSQQVTWNPPADVVRFTLRDQILICAQDRESELPVAVLGRHGRGRYLYLGARLDTVTTLGYSRYPYFVHYLREGFNLNFPLQRGQLELYFDPGLANRQGIDIDRLAEQWRKMGVRAIYAAAYQFWPQWSYDYQHLIDVCHKNGILVYAWFELPHVHMKFWEDHPEWRAKTATGEDGHVGWRYHMDLDIPECQDAAFDFVEEFLKQLAWDGVNLAELNYDTDNGPENPRKYLPMGAPTRAAFRALGGFDPILLFSPESPYYWKHNAAALRKFENYRSQRVLSWHRALLERITPLANERDMEIVVTMLDSLHSKTLFRDTGVNSHLIVSLMNQFPFTLQVEDPAHLWAESPDRYLKFADTYVNLVRDRKRLMFDINVVPDREIQNSHSPTQTLVGIELAQTLIAASQATGRAAIYSEGTIPFEDLLVLSRVLAHHAKLESRWDSWLVQSDLPLLLTSPGPWQSFQINGKLWPGWGESEVLLPGGQNRITPVEKKFRLVDTSALDFRMQHFSGNLDMLAPTNRGLEFSYDSNLRCIALFNRQPHQIQVDAHSYNEQPVHFSGHWSVRLPRGKHKVEIVADSTAYVILDTASLYSSSLIVIFGGVACGLMILLYMAILARRAFSRAVHGKTRSVGSRQ